MNEKLIISVDSQKLASNNTRYSIYEKRPLTSAENVYAAAVDTIGALESSRVSITESDAGSAYDYIADIVREPTSRPAPSYLNCDIKIAVVIITILSILVITILFAMFIVDWMKFTNKHK
jgi:hypothetical protein